MTALQDADLLVEVNGVPHRVSRDEGGLVRSASPGVVVAIPVAAGDEVQAGDVVAVTESMKMESSLTAPVHGRVREVLVSANSHVAAGRPLLQIDPLEDGEAAGAEGERVRFEAADDDATGLQRLAWLVLGYDVTPEEAQRALAQPADLAGERRLLELYADVRGLNRPHSDDELLGSPQEHLHAFLRSLDAEAEGLPDRFVATLERALSHYGIDGLERTAALEHACYRLFVSQLRARTARDAVRTILARHLERAETLHGDARDAYRAVLDRLEVALDPREPALAELAREVRWRCCDEPLIEATREETYAEMAEHLRALAEEPSGEDRDARLDALVSCPQPLASLLGRRVGEAGPLVDAMTRRYYRIRPFGDVAQRLVEGVPFVLADYEHEGVRHHVAATLGEAGDLPRALHALGAHAATLPPDEPVLADLYVLRSAPTTPARCSPRPGSRATWRGRRSSSARTRRAGRSTSARTAASTTAAGARAPTSAACTR